MGSQILCSLCRLWLQLVAESLQQWDSSYKLRHNMPRGRRSVDADLMAAAADSTEQLVRVLERLTPVTVPSFRTPTFNGEGEAELFIEQLRDVTDANRWSERDKLLHLRGCLEGTARVCGQSDSTRGTFDSCRTRYGISTRQAKEHLLTHLYALKSETNWQ